MDRAVARAPALDAAAAGRGYILDLACRQARLAVELDGDQHAMAAAYDARRDATLRVLGWTVLRFWNADALTNTDGTVRAITLEIEALTGAPMTFVSPRQRS